MKTRNRFSRRKRPLVRRTTGPGASPGTVAPPPDAHPTTVRVLAYGPDRVEDSDLDDLDRVRELLPAFPVVWVDVAGLAAAERIQAIGRLFSIHPLALEDVANPHQRAKVEQFESQDFIVMRMPPLPGEEDTDQLSLFLGEGVVITFQERPGDCLDPVRERIRKQRGRIRNLGADYLAYAIIDAVIDSYFPLLEQLGEQLEDLEDDTVLRPSPGIVATVYDIRRRLLAYRRAVWPLREAINVLVRDPVTRVGAETRIYLRDCYDHAVQIVDLLELYRETASGLMEVYLSSISNRMNEIMKVLTIISTLFIPLTFLAGLYGMNFNTQASPLNMPELNWRWGYPLLIAGMIAITVGQVLFFRRRGWIGAAARGESSQAGGIDKQGA
jgi:magnesium transporter